MSSVSRLKFLKAAIFFLCFWCPARSTYASFSRLHLKRFGNEQQKIGTSVEYPCSDLDVSALAYGDNTDAPRYDLYAVSDHHGSVNFGHYTSSCKLVTEEAFYSFNDEEVDEMVDLDGSKVYILFYKLRNK